MNPNTCTFCELAFTRIMKARNVTIDATVLFADLRGYTSASQYLATDQMTSTLDAFYDECAEAIWEHDGLQQDNRRCHHGGVQFSDSTGRSRSASFARGAPNAAPRWGVRRTELAKGFDLDEGALCIGVGIASGSVSFGEFGQSHRDLTAIGTVVNTAARAQSVARAGQILVTKTVRDQCENDICDKGTKYDLKGLAAPIELYDPEEYEDPHHRGSARQSRPHQHQAP
jgi:class 3 adenylate cyclase